MAQVITNETHFMLLVENAVELAVTKALVATGQTPATISQKQAYELYGRRDIDRWVKEGLVTRIQDGDKSGVRYSVEQLTKVAIKSNRHTYLEFHER